METVLTRLSRPQVEGVRARFPHAVKERAILIKGATVTFRVPDGATPQQWEASPLQVQNALALGEQHQPDHPTLRSLVQRLETVINGGHHRDVRVTTDPADEKENA